MTGEASAPVGSQIFEECIACGDRGDAGLKGRDAASGIGIDLKLWNDWRRSLGALCRILEHAHRLRVVDGTGRPIPPLRGIDDVDGLRQRSWHRTTQETNEGKTCG